MDRLNQLRGGAGASGDSTQDASSLVSEGYLTANDSSKYFSLSEEESSTSTSQPKEVGDVTDGTTLSDAERIISNLSPIPKNSELDGFKIGDQIEAAKILSGGVNIFDDNDNSYDGDELVIDDAVTEEDNQAVELKLGESPDNCTETFEKTDTNVDTNADDAEGGSSSKDSEVVLQIDGKNVGAIDIGNGLYLYRKDGEDELAAVQILENVHDQPNMKFLKVRENAEGNLEVYEEIEIEVPKEVPARQGKTIKNSCNILVKDINSEPATDNIAENESQTGHKDTDMDEAGQDVNKDNIHESKTEGNLNGKMIKFSESRKSPLIGTFTPMTYHSTPNKEGIPLTKTMVDLQLHPNRHSENVKKTIEVHTDSKQRLIDTPTKNNKDANEHSKSSELSISSLEKESDLTDRKAEQNNHESKLINRAIIENKTEEINNINTNNDEKVRENKNILQHQQIKPFDKNIVESNVAKDDKTEISDIKMSSLTKGNSLDGLDAGCKLNTEYFDDQDCQKTKQEKSSINEIARNDVVKSQSQIDKLKEQVVEENLEKNSKSVGIVINEDKSAISEPDSIKSKHKNAKSFIAEKPNESDTVVQKINAESSQTDVEVKDSSIVKQLENNSVDLKCEPSSKKSDIYNLTEHHMNKPSQILDSCSKDLKLLNNAEIKDSENKTVRRSCKNIAAVDEVKLDSLSQVTNLQQEMEIDSKVKTSPEKLTKSVHNISNPNETKTDILRGADLIHHESKSKDSVAKSVESKSDFKLKDSTQIKSTEDEENMKSDNLSETKVKKLVLESTLQAEVLSKPTANTGDLVSNTEIKPILDKVSLETEQKCSSNHLQSLKSRTAEKMERQSKNESGQKLPTPKEASLVTSNSKTHVPIQNVSKDIDRNRSDTKKEPNKVSKDSIPRPINNNQTEVPFGKWTTVNSKEFLNKIKETKIPITTSNTKHLKQPNDLNRRDVLQKIDSQRQSNIAAAKVQELNALNKNISKRETATFGSKTGITQKEKPKDNNRALPLVSKSNESKVKDTVSITSVENKIGHDKKIDKDLALSATPVTMSSTSVNVKKDPVRRKEINNQDLIDKTIEGIINRAVVVKPSQDDIKQNTDLADKSQNAHTSISLDEIESKMNELHGIPFVERPPHQLPQVIENDHKNSMKPDVKIENIKKKTTSGLPTCKPPQKSEQKLFTRALEESDEEIIEHVPLTGDLALKNNTYTPVKDTQPQEIIPKVSHDTKKEAIITENEFEKFARRNSITYENCLTVNFDGKEHHNVIQTVVEKEPAPKKLSRNEIMLAESKAKCNKQLAMRHSNFPNKPSVTKTPHDEESYNKNYQSKVQIAYQSVMTTKRQQECPISIIEDKPVKVVFMDENHEYTPLQHNVKGKELSPHKKSVIDWDHFTHSNSESLDSAESALDTSYDSKSQDDIKFKSKHQRKQVLTPVEAPELELIEPSDLGIEVSPKRKRKVEENKPEKNTKSLAPKKSYLLNRAIANEDAPSKSHNYSKIPLKESANQQDTFPKQAANPVSAIDNLVKAAELLETQSECNHVVPSNAQSSPTPSNTTVKRGRGRPRKHPFPEPSSKNKSPSPVKTPTSPKKTRLIDAKISKYETDSEDEDADNGQLVKENWSMGEINTNIVCPICNKLFRTEYVVYKHVTHCSAPSTSRSDSDKRSPRRMRQSQESDWKSEGSKSDSMDIDEDYETNKPIRRRKLKESKSSTDEKLDAKTDPIVIEDTPIKDNAIIKKRETVKLESNKTFKTKVQDDTTSTQTNSLMCEFCGKTFRQLSYLVNHKLQHKNKESKKIENAHTQKSLFSCEICSKEFRKLHHLVQHRNIHLSMNSTRKRSSDQCDVKTTNDIAKPIEDQSAGFRCEPCDKSFRKLHHLVEHRETHDEINKKCNPDPSSAVDTSPAKPNPLHHCDICKQTFKKLQHLIEHKEHHLDTSSEKSDDKSVKSSLSTKDIIHECPLCYMVFPNEHSLNKHHVICQRKKKQSAAKQSKQNDDKDIADTNDETQARETSEEILVEGEQKTDTDTSCVIIEDESPAVTEKEDSTKVSVKTEDKEAELTNSIKTEGIPHQPQKTQSPEIQNKPTNKKDGPDRNPEKLSAKSNKSVVTARDSIETIVIPDTPTPKKRPVAKDKIGAVVTKRQKTIPLPVQDEGKTTDTSDDDEVRYMLNPDYQKDESTEGKLFMKVRAKKRNSLQIERPNSKDLMKRRISLQHPPKIPRLKVKPVPRKIPANRVQVRSSRSTTAPEDPPPSVDSDDSDVKYSFPEAVMKEMVKEEQKKAKQQTMIEKRKSSSNIAKRKSLVKTIITKKIVTPTPVKQIKKRSKDVEHRCDCGELFTSAALLSRHTSLAHTPPRVRRRRSPPPDHDARPAAKRNDKHQDTRHSRKTIDANGAKKSGVTTRKSSVNSEASKPASQARSVTKMPRTAAHRGVPVPEKMRKLLEKSKK